MEYPEWQKVYREALLEVDPQKLPARIFAAEMAILVRMTALQTSSDGQREREAIKDALSALDSSHVYSQKVPPFQENRWGIP